MPIANGRQFVKQPVLTPRFTYQTTRIDLTSSEVSVAGSCTIMSIPSIPATPRLRPVSPVRNFVYENLDMAAMLADEYAAAVDDDTIFPMDDDPDLQSSVPHETNVNNQAGYVLHPQMTTGGAGPRDAIGQEGAGAILPSNDVATSDSSSIPGEDFPQRPMTKVKKALKKARDFCFRICGV